jgi:hypothetical protein
MISVKECLKIGGHCWNYFSANDVVDEQGNKGMARYLVYYPDGEPQYRKCKHCGITEKLESNWVKR